MTRRRVRRAIADFVVAATEVTRTPVIIVNFAIAALLLGALVYGSLAVEGGWTTAAGGVVLPLLIMFTGSSALIAGIEGLVKRGRSAQHSPPDEDR